MLFVDGSIGGLVFFWMPLYFLSLFLMKTRFLIIKRKRSVFSQTCEWGTEIHHSCENIMLGPPRGSLEGNGLGCLEMSSNAFKDELNTF